MSKVVIVTGGSGGLGAEIGLRFGLAGAKVVINDIDYLDDAEAVAKKINEIGAEAFVHKADVCNYEQVKGMVEATLSRWDRIDVLVNNAGGMHRWLGKTGQLVTEMKEEVWRKIIDLNVTSPFICIKAVAPQMIKQGEGHIINVSSGLAVSGGKGFSPYSAAKAGMIALSKSAARELGDYNIKVNTVWPQPTTTDRVVKEDKLSKETVNEFVRQSLLHRTGGSAQEFAEFIVHLSGMENVTGQLFALDSRILF
ncbi:SDR family NAD(P)-dependent oxidoreductase [Chloroflexota bacterium]